eukprot:CAMPEP_0177660122 /NCGR_PEP_ID=MMETSP0447-20121125/17839_1 /TAXON_ID=0 /ORGANISM="Stygamoeba regulata, Strain BSH-02190019" /LENGTH=436 /DNA_ID=CAMNT_0019165101 /DNA_START=17 /DNA_END=1324 /DNA_ORIENTATION=+
MALVWLLAVISFLFLPHGVLSGDPTYENIELRVISLLPKQQYIHSFSTSPITVVFNRPVIRLGQDYGSVLPNKLNPFRVVPEEADVAVPVVARWLTTNVARLEAKPSWVSDLRFNVSINPDLVAFDGAQAANAADFNRAYHTSPQRVSFVKASSDGLRRIYQAEADTPQLEVDGVLEVPPDGVVAVHFAFPVDVALVAQALRLVHDQSQHSVGLSVEACLPGGDWDWDPAHCVNVTVAGGLLPGQTYRLFLPAHTRYHPSAMSITEEVGVALAGLRPFQVHFHTADRGGVHTQYQRFAVWLEHGLHANTSVDALAAVLAFDPPMPFSTSLDATRTLVELAVHVPIPLNSTFSLTVRDASDVRDTFGQPLTGSAGHFIQSFGAAGFAILYDSVMFDGTMDVPLSVLASSNTPHAPRDVTVSTVPITLENVQEILGWG